MCKNYKTSCRITNINEKWKNKFYRKTKKKITHNSINLRKYNEEIKSTNGFLHWFHLKDIHFNNDYMYDFLPNCSKKNF